MIATWYRVQFLTPGWRGPAHRVGLQCLGYQGCAANIRRARSPRHDGEAGSALIETVFVICVLLVPLIWVALALLRVEAASYAVRTAAREAARTYVTAASSAQGQARAEAASRLAFEDQKAPIGSTRLSCSANPCLTPGATVSAQAQTSVGLPFLPGWLTAGTGLRITVNSHHSETVERYGGVR